jgi:hypothetical protein
MADRVRDCPSSTFLRVVSMLTRVCLLAGAADIYCEPACVSHFFFIVGCVSLSEYIPRLAAGFEDWFCNVL